MSQLSGNLGTTRKRKHKAALRELYGDCCHWCGGVMDFSGIDYDECATLEHLVPRSEGGTNERSNLRLAHKRCNVDRSYPQPRRARQAVAA